MTPEYIMRKVAEWHNVAWDEVASRCIKREVVAARHEGWFLCALLTEATFTEIASVGGWKRDHVSRQVVNYTGPDRSIYIKTYTTPKIPCNLPVTLNSKYCRAYFQKIKSDPERYREYLEKRRIKRHAKRAEASAHV